LQAWDQSEYKTVLVLQCQGMTDSEMLLDGKLHTTIAINFICLSPHISHKSAVFHSRHRNTCLAYIS